MSYLLDTCAISYLRKGNSPRAQKWFSQHDSDLFFVSVVTIAELESGIAQLDASRKKNDLMDWFYGDFHSQFEDRILPIDIVVAKEWGQLAARLKKKGMPGLVQDLYIAATAKVNGLAVVTANVKDFAPTGVVTVNPWE